MRILWLWLFIASWQGPGVSGRGGKEEEERLIGWQGEVAIQAPTWVEVIAWKPRAFIFHHFISDAEVGMQHATTCQHHLLTLILMHACSRSTSWTCHGPR